MDPTIELCRVRDTFTTEEPVAKTPVAFKLDPVPPLQPNIETSHVFEVPNLPADPRLVNTKLYRTLEKVKDAYDHPQFEQARLLTNPFEDIGNSTFMNRAAVKMANLDIVFDITNHQGGLLGMQDLKGHLNEPPTEGGYTFCDIAAAPGGFTQYIQFRIPRSFGYGMSVRSGIRWKERDLDMNRFNILWGSDGTGDLYTNADWFAERVSSTQVAGVDLVMCDGGFEVEGDYEKQEFLSTRLIMAEVLVGLQVLKHEGVFVCKVFDTVTTLMAELLFIIASCFEEFYILKPMSSRPANSERYVVAKRLRMNVKDQYIQHLRNVNDAYEHDRNVTKMIREDSIPTAFIDYIRDGNNYSIGLQLETGKKILQFLADQQVEIPEYDLTRSLVYWNIPDNPPPDKRFTRGRGRGGRGRGRGGPREFKPHVGRGSPGGAAAPAPRTVPRIASPELRSPPRALVSPGRPIMSPKVGALTMPTIALPKIVTQPPPVSPGRATATISPVAFPKLTPPGQIELPRPKIGIQPPLLKIATPKMAAPKFTAQLLMQLPPLTITGQAVQPGIQPIQGTTAEGHQKVDIALEQLNNTHRPGIEQIVRDPEVMRKMGQAVIWDDEKISQTFDWADADWKLSPQKRGYFTWAITTHVPESTEPITIGMVSIHVVNYDKELDVRGLRKFFLTIMIDRAWQGRGIGADAVKRAIREFHAMRPDVKVIISDIHIGNVPSERLMTSVGFKLLRKSVNIGKITMNRYVFDVDE